MLYVVVNVWIALCCCFGRKNATVAGTQWRDLLLSPKRDRLAQERLARPDQGDTHELSLRRSALFWARHCLAQARDARL